MFAWCTGICCGRPGTGTLAAKLSSAFTITGKRSAML
jgi:hypothetical protein